MKNNLATVFAAMILFCSVQTVAQRHVKPFPDDAIAPESAFYPISPQTNVEERGPAPDWNWMQRTGGSAGDYGAAIAKDGNGNLYVTGTFSGSTQFDTQNLQSSGVSDGFVAKYDANGNLLWLRQIQGSSAGNAVVGSGIALDGSGNVFVAGHFTGDAVIAGGQTYFGTGSGDLYLVKFNNAGQVDWLTTQPSYTAPKKIQTDATGNVFVLTQPFLYGFHNNGALLWQLYPDVINGDYSLGTILLHNNQLFLAGVFVGEVAFGSTNLQVDQAGYFLATVDQTTGDFTNAAILAETSDPYFPFYNVNDIAFDNAGNLFFAGYFRTILSSGACTVFASSQRTTFVAKWNNGNCQWIVAPDDASMSSFDYAIGIVLDSNGDPLVYGYKNETLTFSGLAVPFDNQFGYSIKLNTLDGEPEWAVSHPWVYAGVLTSGGGVAQVGADQYDAYLRHTASNGSTQWFKTNSSDSGYGLIGSIESDDSGVYILGNVGGQAQFVDQTLSIPQNSFVVAKTNFKGDAVYWHRVIEGALAVSYGQRMVLHKATDKLYCLGTYKGTLTLGAQTLTNNSTEPHAFLVQLDTDGSYGWAVDLGLLFAIGLSADATGNILISGRFSDSLTLGNTTVTDAGLDDIVIAKYNALGQQLWVKRAGGSDIEFLALVTADGQDNIYFAGEFYSESVDYDGVFAIGLPDGAGHVLLGKLNPAGQLLWIKSHGGSNQPNEEYSCFPSALKADTSGNCYMMGFMGVSNFFGNIHLTSPYYINNFIAKFDLSGDPLWAKVIVQKSFSINYGELDIDENGNCYPSGQLRDSCWFDGVLVTRQGGQRDAYMAKYANADGSVEWIKTLYGSSNVTLAGMSVYNEQSLLVGGYFTDRLYYDGSEFNAKGGFNGYFGLLGEDIIVSVKESDAGQSLLHLSPNPSGGLVRIGMASDKPVMSPADIEVMDSKGMPVWKRSVGTAQMGQGIDLTVLPAGVYYVKITLNNISETKRVIIH